VLALRGREVAGELLVGAAGEAPDLIRQTRGFHAGNIALSRSGWQVNDPPSPLCFQWQTVVSLALGDDYAPKAVIVELRSDGPERNHGLGIRYYNKLIAIRCHSYSI
jgi:hypothetical protein